MNSSSPAPSAKIAVIGGDLRQLEAAKALCQRGFQVWVFGLDVVGESGARAGIHVADNPAQALYGASLLLLPLPYSRDGIHINAPLSTTVIPAAPLFSLVEKNTLVAAGMIDDAFPKELRQTDYAAGETFAIRNAALTAEGALAVAIRETRFALNGSRVLITGFGRIGKLLAPPLRALGADVTVLARKETDRAWAVSMGLRAAPFDDLADLAPTADLIFNTVPAPVIGRPVLSVMRRSALIVELASLPGGVDLRAAAEYGVNLVTALGLPGKYAPESAGRIIADQVAGLLPHPE